MSSHTSTRLKTQLTQYAYTIHKPLKEILNSDEHSQDLAQIIYPHIPKWIKWKMSEPEFIIFYTYHRKSFFEIIKEITIFMTCLFLLILLSYMFF